MPTTCKSLCEVLLGDLDESDLDPSFQGQTRVESWLMAEEHDEHRDICTRATEMCHQSPEEGRGCSGE